MAAVAALATTKPPRAIRGFVDAYRIADLARERAAAGKRYLEFHRAPSMSLGLYVLRAGEKDPQRPHGEDEAYFVVAGRGRFTSGGTTVDVEAGAVLFVPAREEHRFHDIVEDLEILVLFAPPEGSA